MTLVLLGIIPTGAPVPADVAPHRAIPAGAWTGLALDLPAGHALSSEEEMIRFAQTRHAVLCHYATQADVIPVTPDQAFSDPNAVVRRIDRDATRIAGIHARLAGCVEYALAVDTAPEVASHPQAATGRDHLRLRARMRDVRGDRGRARGAFVEKLGRDVADRVERIRNVAGRAAPRLARIDLLVRRDRFDDCTSAISHLLADAQALGLDLSLTGPYPPFSFLDGGFDD